jgi:hypothetical protein
MPSRIEGVQCTWKNNDLDFYASSPAPVGSRVDSGREKKMRDFVEVFEFLVYFSLPQMVVNHTDTEAGYLHGVLVVLLRTRPRSIFPSLRLIIAWFVRLSLVTWGIGKWVA